MALLLPSRSPDRSGPGRGPTRLGPSFLLAVATGLLTGPLAMGASAGSDGAGAVTAGSAAMMMRAAAGVDAQKALPVEGAVPSLSGAVRWLNSPPLTTAGLKGKVVLVDFWTYSCINCLRAVPYVRAWAEKYAATGSRRDRRACARVRVREEPRQRGARRSPICRSPIRSPSTTTTRSGVPSTTSTGRLTTSRRRGRIRSPPFRRRRLRRVRAGDSTADRGSGQDDGGDGRRRGASGGSARRRRRKRTSSRPRPTSAMRGGTLRVGRRSDSRTSVVRMRRGRPAPQRVGVVGRLDDRARARDTRSKDGSIVYRFHARDLHLVLGAAPRTTDALSRDDRRCGAGRQSRHGRRPRTARAP